MKRGEMQVKCEPMGIFEARVNSEGLHDCQFTEGKCEMNLFRFSESNWIRFGLMVVLVGQQTGER